MSSTPTDFLEELECPVCSEYMRPPIRMCQIGHSICHICESKTEKCPQCQSDFILARNFSLERMAEKLEVKCQNSVYGCNYKNKVESIKDHEIKCWFIQGTCPLSLLGKCDFKSSVRDIKGHLRQKHKAQIQKCNISKKSDKCIMWLESKNFCNTFLFADIDNDFFVVTSSKLYASDGSQNLKWNIYFVGLPHIAAKFDYEIKIKDSPQSRRGYLIGGICEPAYSDNGEFNEKRNIQISLDSVKECVDTEGSLNFNFKVTERQ